MQPLGGGRVALRLPRSAPLPAPVAAPADGPREPQQIAASAPPGDPRTKGGWPRAWLSCRDGRTERRPPWQPGALGFGLAGPVASRRRSPGRSALTLALGLAIPLAQFPAAALGPQTPLPQKQPSEPPCRRQGQRHFDVILYGDEPAGVMTALELSRQLPRLAGLSRPRIALLTPSDLRAGLGGTIARSGLAYLDRNQVPRDMWGALPPFAPSSDLYRRFLRLTGVHQIAVDPRKASRAFQRALGRARVTLLAGVEPTGTELEPAPAPPWATPPPAGQRLCVIETAGHGRLGADLFIDASLGADLAHRASVPFLRGLGPRGLSRESISLGWIFEVEGLTITQMRNLEEQLTRRLLDRRDREAQHWLVGWPAYRNSRQRLLADLVDQRGNPLLFYSATSDSADQQSPALSIAVHGEQGLAPGLRHAPARMDAANVAILPDRLSFNALLFRNSADQNREVIARHGRPLGWMVPAAQDVESFFLRHGARRVHWMPELYIRSADQIAHPRMALSAGLMARGGVARQEALGTFSYHLDFRGGISAYVPPAKPTFNFGYRHTLPREVSNLAVLGPASGFGGLGEGAGRIIELNISVGQGLAIASALALGRHIPLAAVDPREVARLMPAGFTPYGRPSGSTAFSLFLGRLLYRLETWFPRWPWEPEWHRPLAS